MTEDPIPPRLLARTVEIADPGPLPELMPRSGAYAWLRSGDGMVGWGEVVRHKATTIAEAEEWWHELCGSVEQREELSSPPSGAGLMAFGSFAFDDANTAAQSALVVPETVVGRRQGRAWVTTIGSDSASPGWAPVREVAQPPRLVTYADGSLTGPQWQAVVAEVVSRINDSSPDGAGTQDALLDKVVLARDLLAYADADLDPRWLVARLARDYTRCWTYLVDGLVGATPEMLIRREGGLATSRVLAGTIRRTGDDQRDLALAAALAQSSKDLEEHEYAVASVARALAPYCSGLHVPEAPYVLELPNVMHLATDVTAVAQGPSSLALAAALHPSAAVCGTPTGAARRTIRELEQLDRERYAGPVGWLDASGDGEWGIALRCGQICETDPRQIRLFAGCGIVSGSDPGAELAESNAKLVPMRDALGD